MERDRKVTIARWIVGLTITGFLIFVAAPLALNEYAIWEIEHQPRRVVHSDSVLDPPETEIPASAAHSPVISLSRFVTVGHGKNVTKVKYTNYWSVMVSAVSTADAPIDIALGDCTFFDANHEPMGNGSASFQNLIPGVTKWAKAEIESDNAPSYVDCQTGVAYNRN